MGPNWTVRSSEKEGQAEARARASCPLTPQLTLSDTFTSLDTSIAPSPGLLSPTSSGSHLLSSG